MNKLLITILLLISTTLVVNSAWATTWYIRSDGGTDTQCTGLADAAYPGSGTGQPCAYSHNYYLTGWYKDGSASTGGTMHMAGGDTVQFRAGDSFKQGYDAAWTGCNAASWPYECFPRPWPSGTAGAHTVVKGSSASNRPILWATRAIGQALYISSNDYIDISNLELTDHINC